MNKAYFRKQMLTIRAKISHERKEQAAINALFVLQKKLQKYSYVLSFYSLPSEISLFAMNTQLSLENRLLLPKIEEKGLFFYLVNDLEKQVILSSNKIVEPNPEFCEKFSDLKHLPALIPGIAFSLSENLRIGYGKGYYDRFLSIHPSLEKIGIGYKEQKVEKLPTDKWDVALDEILLF